MNQLMDKIESIMAKDHRIILINESNKNITRSNIEWIINEEIIWQNPLN